MRYIYIYHLEQGSKSNGLKQLPYFRILISRCAQIYSEKRYKFICVHHSANFPILRFALTYAHFISMNGEERPRTQTTQLALVNDTTSKSIDRPMSTQTQLE